MSEDVGKWLLTRVSAIAAIDSTLPVTTNVEVNVVRMWSVIAAYRSGGSEESSEPECSVLPSWYWFVQL